MGDMDAGGYGGTVTHKSGGSLAVRCPVGGVYWYGYSWFCIFNL